MKIYAIRRRNGWNNAEELEAAAAKSRRIGDEEMPGVIGAGSLLEHPPAFLILFLVDLAAGETFFEYIERCLSAGAARGAALPGLTEPAHQQQYADDDEGDEQNHHQRTEKPAVPAAVPHVALVVAGTLLRPGR